MYVEDLNVTIRNKAKQISIKRTKTTVEREITTKKRKIYNNILRTWYILTKLKYEEFFY